MHPRLSKPLWVIVKAICSIKDKWGYSIWIMVIAHYIPRNSLCTSGMIWAEHFTEEPGFYEVNTCHSRWGEQYCSWWSNAVSQQHVLSTIDRLIYGKQAWLVQTEWPLGDNVDTRVWSVHVQVGWLMCTPYNHMWLLEGHYNSTNIVSVYIDTKSSCVER